VIPSGAADFLWEGFAGWSNPFGEDIAVTVVRGRFL
jgi:hypothetical protein